MSLKHIAASLKYRKDHKMSRLYDTRVQSVINYYPIARYESIIIHDLRCDLSHLSIVKDAL